MTTSTVAARCYCCCCIAQAAPSMVYLPAHTVEEKVAALRACLPGIDLYNFLKGMPTALARSKQTVPRGMDQLREVSFFVSNLRRSGTAPSEGEKAKGGGELPYKPSMGYSAGSVSVGCWCTHMSLSSGLAAPPRHVLCQTIRVLCRSIAMAATMSCLLRHDSIHPCSIKNDGLHMRARFFYQQQRFAHESVPTPTTVFAHTPEP